MKSTAVPAGLRIITPADIHRIFPHIKSYKGAWDRIKRVKEGLGKKKHQQITVVDLAEWEGLDVSIIMVTLNRD